MIAVRFYTGHDTRQRRIAQAWLPAVPRIGEEVHIANANFVGHVREVTWFQDFDDAWAVEVCLQEPMSLQQDE